MTSINSFDTLRKNRKRWSLWSRIAFFVLLVVMVLGVLRWRTNAATLFWKLGAPVSTLRNRVEGSTLTDLRAQLASTTAALADRDALSVQNIELKRLLGRQQRGVQVVASILMRPPGLPYDTLIIDAGTADGIAPGELVYGGGNSSIGEITDAYANTARVTLFSAAGRAFDAEVEPAATPGAVLPLSLNGQGAGSMVGQVPSGSRVVVGDPIIIPGLGSAFVGSVSHIDAPAGLSFETLYVQLPVNIFSLQYVEVQTHQ